MLGNYSTQLATHKLIHVKLIYLQIYQYDNTLIPTHESLPYYEIQRHTYFYCTKLDKFV